MSEEQWEDLSDRSEEYRSLRAERSTVWILTADDKLFTKAQHLLPRLFQMSKIDPIRNKQVDIHVCIRLSSRKNRQGNTPAPKRGFYALPIFATEESLDSKSTLSHLGETRKPG